jgi:hypothetical protein
LGLGTAGESIKLLMRSMMIIAMYRLVVILIGRLRLSPSKAIEAYLKLVAVIPNEPAKDDEERKANTEKFKAVFMQVLGDAGFDENTPMLVEDGPKM